MYFPRRCEGLLAQCIGRVLVGVDRSLGFIWVFFLGIFGMSVEVAIHFVRTYVF